MKQIILFFAFVLAGAISAVAQRQPMSASVVASPETGAQMRFETVDLNYGEIQKGANGDRVFVFSNTGTMPLIITNASGSCGCTVPTAPKDPIMPGEKSVIKVHYDTNRVGSFTKYVTLTTNAAGQETFKLTIRGNVLQPTDLSPNGNTNDLQPGN